LQNRVNVRPGLIIWCNLSNEKGIFGTWNVKSLYRAGSLDTGIDRRIILRWSIMK
jgi:hypothetical protein